MQGHHELEVLLTCADDPLGIVRRLPLDQPGESFGLLEPGESGWTLCIPHGSVATASVDGRPVDLGPLPVDAAGERHLPVGPGLWAQVVMGSFEFCVRPT